MRSIPCMYQLEDKNSKKLKLEKMIVEMFSKKMFHKINIVAYKQKDDTMGKVKIRKNLMLNSFHNMIKMEDIISMKQEVKNNIINNQKINFMKKTHQVFMFQKVYTWKQEIDGIICLNDSVKQEPFPLLLILIAHQNQYLKVISE